MPTFCTYRQQQQQYVHYIAEQRVLLVVIGPWMNLPRTLMWKGIFRNDVRNSSVFPGSSISRAIPFILGHRGRSNNINKTMVLGAPTKYTSYSTSTAALWGVLLILRGQLLLNKESAWCKKDMHYDKKIIRCTMEVNKMTIEQYSIEPKISSLWPSDAIWRCRSCSTLVPDGIKPLPEPMLTDHQWNPVTFISGQFHRRYLNHQSLKSVWKLRI